MNAESASGFATEHRARADGRDWMLAMRAGEFEAAWSISDRDLLECRQAADANRERPRHEQRIWRGEELRNRHVLVRCYHGLGDTIQFARFLPALAERARELTVWCQPELLALIARVPGVGRALPVHDGAPDVDFEADIEIMEIPHAIRAGRDLIEPRGPYLTLPPADAPTCFARQEGLSVGLIWEAGKWQKRRAVPAHLLKRLSCEGIELYSLQKGDDAATEASEIGATNIGTADLIALGHRMSKLDLVVSVDTMTAHLAGALGLEVWVMLHVDCDWRWPVNGGRSIWYPRARLFHQVRAGDWAGAIANIRSALGERIGARKNARLLSSERPAFRTPQWALDPGGANLQK